VVPPFAAVAAFAAPDGLAVDIALAATASALAAAVMALVALFIDCIAVDIVLADDVALAAAVVILVAAEVTLVAAADAVLATEADVGDVLAAADRAALTGTLPADCAALTGALTAGRIVLTGAMAADALIPVGLTFVLVVVRGSVPEPLESRVLVALLRAAVTGFRRAAAWVVAFTGTDLPPIFDQYGRAIPPVTAIYTR
jgi:hypothetical protein